MVLRKIEKQNIFELNKIKFLQDAIINLDKFKKKKKFCSEN